MLCLPSRLPLRAHSPCFLSIARLGSRAVSVGAEKPWAENRQHYSKKDGLALQTFLALVREGKQKRNLSVTSTAESVSPEHESSRDLNLSSMGCKNSVSNRFKDQQHKAGNLSASIFVDPPLLGFLIGKGGATRQMIEKGTGVSLKIPSTKEAKAGKHVVLQGKSREALDDATHQVHEIIDQAIKSPRLQYSHFVSIPLALHSNLLESVVDFQNSVLASDSSSSGGLKDKGIDKSIFVKPTTFHLTLLMLKLWNEDRVKAAADCLQRVMPLVHESLEASPLTIKLRGVDCMKGNPATAHVLYADVEPDRQAARLIIASQVITKAFTEAGLVTDRDQTQALKLHATLMNTAQRSGGGSGKRYPKRIPFDATEIMAKYKQHEWGQYHVPEAHLSQRFVYDENGYYHCCSSIPFPEQKFGRKLKLVRIK